jgi:hypothetical protein
MIAILLVIAAETAVRSNSATGAVEEDKIQCRPVYQIYSRIPDRICRRKSDWARIEKENQEDFLNSRNSRASGRSGTIVNSAEGGVVSPSPMLSSPYRPPR